MMPGQIWTGVIARALLPAVAYRYQLGRDLDADWDHPEIPHTVGIAQMLAPALSPWGVFIPERDHQLGALLDTRGRPAGVGVTWTVAVHGEGPRARCGIVTPSGVIESAGEHLALITSPESDRYRARWLIPGVHYTGHARGEEG